MLISKYWLTYPFQNLYPLYILWAIAFQYVLDYTYTQEEALPGTTKGTYSKGQLHRRSQKP